MVPPTPPKPNQMYRAIQRINTSFPSFLRSKAFTWGFNSLIPYSGTTGLVVEQLDATRAVVHCRNRRRVQNHIKGVHATAMATLAESATGMLFGQYVPDNTHLPLLKSMNIQYKRMAKGNLTATATLTDEQIRLISTTDRGSTVVDVVVKDESGNEPIECALEWAWTVRKQNEKSTKK